MYKKNIHVFCLIIIFSFITSFIPIHASPYDIILVGEPVLEDIRFLSLETGISFLSFTPPFAPHEIKNFLNKIDETKLSTAGLEAYNRLFDRLNPKAPRLSLSWEYFTLFFNIESTLEGKARFNDSVEYPDNPKIPSFLSLVTNFYFADKVQLYFDPAISIDPADYSFNGHSSNGYLATNILLLNNNHINGNTPLRTFIAAGGNWWNFQLGRDRLSYGTGITGNLGIADNPPFYEFMRLSFFSKHFKYSLLINQSPLHVNTNNVLIDREVHPNIDNLFNEGLMDKTTQRFFYLHRIDFTLFNRLSISLMEGVMAGNSGLELRLMNPLMIIHNAMTWRNYNFWSDSPDLYDSYLIGSFFSAEINWNISRAFSFYTQFVMNELAFGHETQEGRDEAPNALGFMVGFQHSFTLKNWSAIAFLESFYTLPFLYLNGSPFASFISMNMVGFTHENFYYYWYGYPRDTFSITTGVKSRSINDTIGLDIDFSWIASGEKNKNGVIWDHKRSAENFNLKSPSGIVENRFILSTGVRWAVYSWLTLQTKLSGMYFMNNKHIQDENEFNGQISLSATFRY